MHLTFKYKTYDKFNYKATITLILAIFVSTLSFAQNSYSGNGNTIGGGTLGDGSITFDDDGTTISGVFTRGSGRFNHSLVIYIDSKQGGFSNTSTFDDIASLTNRGRPIVSGYNGSVRSTVTFPQGFEVDYAISLAVSGIDSSELFELSETGSHTLVDLVSLGLATLLQVQIMILIFLK